MAKIYSLPRALIVGTPKVTALKGQKDVQTEKKDPQTAKSGGLKTELVGRSAISRHSCSQLLAAITAPFEVGHYSLTYGQDFPRSKAEIQDEKHALTEAGKYAGLFGIWTLEFQQRFAPHWHCLLWERVPGAKEKFVKWWHKHTANDSERAIVVRQGDEAKASWYFNFHQEKQNQTPLVRVGRWWGKVDGAEVEKWIHCEHVASTHNDKDVINLKRIARRMHALRYRETVRAFLAGKSDKDPRKLVRQKRSKDSLPVVRRSVHRCRVARSSLGPQGFTWFLRESDHGRVLSWVDGKSISEPFVNWGKFLCGADVLAWWEHPQVNAHVLAWMRERRRLVGQPW